MARWGYRQQKLAKAGIIGKNQYTDLTSYQKRKLGELWKKYGEVAEAPTDFVKRRVGKKTAAKMRDSGYAVKGQTVYAPRAGARAVHINGKRGEIRHTYNDKLVVYPFSDQSSDLGHIEKKAAEIERLQNEAAAMGINTSLTARFGGGGIFKNLIFEDVTGLLFYMQNFKPKDAENLSPQEERELRNELFSSVGIVIQYDDD